jgi:DNA-directed RNA polymerase specialized sigma24 family protein
MNTTIALQELIKGNLTTKVYDHLASRLKTFLFNYTLPPHLDIEDIISITITRAYNAREQFNPELSKEITWFYTIAQNAVLTENKQQNQTQMRIPYTNYVDNTILTDHGEESIFNNLLIEDNEAIDIDMLLGTSDDTSIVLHKFILENKFDALYAFVYNKLSLKEIAIKLDRTLSQVKNDMRAQRQKVLLHFTGTNEFRQNYAKRKEEDPEAHLKQLKYNREKYGNNGEYNKEYREANRDKLNEYARNYYKNKKLNS